MKLGSALKPIATARETARRGKASQKALLDANGTGASRHVADEADGAGLGAHTGSVRKDAAAVEREADLIDALEKQLLSRRPDLKTTGAALGAANAVPRNRLASLFHGFSAYDRQDLTKLALRLAHSGKGGRHNMAGAIREIVAKHLPEVRMEVLRTVLESRRRLRGNREASFLDSGVFGPVELPTRLRKGDRQIRLGTDRIIGVAHDKPRAVEVDWASGSKEKLWAAGDVDVSIAIEVKGRTTAEGGVEQIAALQTRGKQGYAIIGNELWLLRYHPERVTHIVVAPPGPSLTAARTGAGRVGAPRVKFIEIPLAIDNQIFGLADDYLAAARSRGR